MFDFEKKYQAEGFSQIIGIDEVGRGPYAGPVVAAAVILPPNADFFFTGLNDSKKLTAKKREELDALLRANLDVKFAIAEISSVEIDKINILKATHKAMHLAVEKLGCGDFILVDGRKVPGFKLPSQNIIKGDSKSASIAAASILAKVYRDKLMCEYAKIYPQYNFAKNAGYGTAEHQSALDKFGITPIHRRSFAPIAKLLETDEIKLF